MRLPLIALWVLFCVPTLGVQQDSVRQGAYGMERAAPGQRDVEERRRQREQLRSSLQSPTDPGLQAPRRQLSSQERQQLRLQLEAQHKDTPSSLRGDQRR